MNQWTARSIAGESDIAAIIDLRLAIESVEATGFPIQPDRLSLVYLQPRPGWWSDIRLWERAGQLRGISEVRISELEGGDQVAYLRLRIHPDESGGQLPDLMIKECERIAADYFGSDFQIEVSARQSQDVRIALLKRHGYALDRIFNMMVCQLDNPISIAPPPVGYELRPLNGIEEVEGWLSLYINAFSDHYDFHPIAYEERIERMQEATYLPEFDLVVTAPDGELAAFCFCDHREDHRGKSDWHIDLVGAHRAHRGKGLARALLTTTMEMVRQRGGSEVKLEVDATSSTGANRLYERLGFVTVTTSIDYRKRFALVEGALPKG